MALAKPPSTPYQQSLASARAAWLKQEALTVKQMQAAYASSAVALGQQIANLPPSWPVTQWSLSQMQQVIDERATTLQDESLKALHAGVRASTWYAGTSVVAGPGKPLADVFGDEAVDGLVRSVGERAAAQFLTRTGKDGITLSDRVWKANAQYRTAIQKITADAIISGTDKRVLAKSLEQYLLPGVNVPYKEATAKRLKVPKDTSMPAMRLARTELNNAFHEGSIAQHSAAPSYLGIRWRLSGSHPISDECDTYAAQGFFEKGTEPLKPHPHCLCTVLPQHEDPEAFAQRLENWLAKPGSDPALEAWHKDLMGPLLEVQPAPVAGGAQGPLLGGYAKGQKVLVNIGKLPGEYIATVIGEHITKGVLTLQIDAGQGIDAKKIWRAPNKIKPFTGPPTHPTAAASVPPIPAAPGAPIGGFAIGDYVHATAGTKKGISGVISHFDAVGGTPVAYVKWSDGTLKPVVPANIEYIPGNLLGLSPGLKVVLDLPSSPNVHGLTATVTKVNPDGSASIEVLTVHGKVELDLPEVEQWHLKPAPQAPQNIQTPPPGPTIIGYLDDVSSVHHGKAVIQHNQDPFADDYQFEDGTWHTSLTPMALSPTKPAAAPTTPQVTIPTTPPPAAAHFNVDDDVVLHLPGTSYHGSSAKVTGISPTDGMIQVQIPTGEFMYIAPHEAPTVLSKLAPQPGAPLTLIKHDDQVTITDSASSKFGQTGKVTGISTSGQLDVDFPDGSYIVINPSGVAKVQAAPLKVGDEVEITLTSHVNYGQIAKIVHIQPDGVLQLEMPDGSSHLAWPGSVKKQRVAGAPDPIKIGDTVEILDIANQHFGKQGKVSYISTHSGDMDIDFPDGTYTVANLSGVTKKAAAPPAAGIQAGDSVTITAPSHSKVGQSGTVTHVTPGVAHLTMADGSYAAVTPAGLAKAPPPSGPPPTPPPVLATPGTVDVTVKGTIVQTAYKGIPVEAKVLSYNKGKNVLNLQVTTPVTGVVDKFTKSPKLVQAVVPAAGAPPQTPAPTAGLPQTIHQMKKGDQAVINMPGSVHHGKLVTLDDDPGGMSASTPLIVILPNGITASFYKHELLPPHQPIPSVAASASPLPPTVVPTATPTPAPAAQTAYAIGDKLTVNIGQHQGKVGTVVSQTASGPYKLEFDDGTNAFVLPQWVNLHTAAPPTPPTPSPTAPTPGSSAGVTTKGAIVKTEYKGIPVIAKVVLYNAGKKSLVLKPVTPTPGVSAQFNKSPSKVQLDTPPPVGVTPAVVPTVPTPAPAPTPQPTATTPPPKPTVPPAMSQLTPTNAHVGGGHAKTIYKHADGSTWMFKPDPTAAFAEQSGYNVMDLLGLKTPDAVHVMNVPGQGVGSMQRFHATKGEVKFNTVSSLTAAQRADLQEHMIVDWLIAQHDSNQGAMLIAMDDRILAVDKGQAFKFLGRDKLHWTYEPNSDSTVYKPLFEGYIAGRYTLDRSAVESIVRKIEALDDAAFLAAVKPYAQQAVAQGFWPTEQAMYDVLLERKANIRKDVDKLYDDADKKAGRAVTPATATTAQKPAAPTNAITPVNSPQVLDTIARSGVHGQALMVDSGDFESGTVLAYEIKIDGDGTKLILQSKLRTDAEAKLHQNVTGVTAHTPSAAASAPSDPTWSGFEVSLKHIAFHMKLPPGQTTPSTAGQGGDQIVQAAKLSQLKAVAQEIHSGTMSAHKAAHYTDIIDKLTGMTVADVATLPIDQLAANIQQHWLINTGVHSNIYDKYVPPPVAPAGPAAPPPPPTTKVAVSQESPSMLRRRTKDGELHSTGQRTTSTSDGVYGVKMYRMDLDQGIRADFLPSIGHPSTGGSGSTNPYSRHGQLTVEIDDWKGDPAQLQKALDGMARLGLDTRMMDPDDAELLYLRHQIHAMKLEKNSSYKAKLGQINATTPIRDQVQIHVDFLNGHLGVPDVRKLPGYDPRPKFNEHYRATPGGGQTQIESGQPYWERIDITRADLAKPTTQGGMKNWFLTHQPKRGYPQAQEFITSMLTGNGLGANTEERIRQALYDPSQGLSSSADMFTGGSQYFFTRMAKPGQERRGIFHFHTDLLLRTDIISYDRDSFGRADDSSKSARATDTAGWRSNVSRDDNETIIKHGIPLLGYIKEIQAQSASMRQQWITEFKSHGINEIRGVPIEQIITVR